MNLRIPAVFLLQGFDVANYSISKENVALIR